MKISEIIKQNLKVLLGLNNDQNSTVFWFTQSHEKDYSFAISEESV